MARWNTLLLAGALGCWPALGFAQGTLPVPPAVPGGEGVPALPPGAVTSAPVSVTGGSTTSRPARVSLSDMGTRSAPTGYGVPDLSGMPKPDNTMYTGMGMAPMGGDAPAGSFIPAGAQNFCAAPPVGIEPCGTTIHARGPSGLIFDGTINFYRTRRSDPAVLFRSVDSSLGFDVVTGEQQDYDLTTGVGYSLGMGWLAPNGWFGMITYRRYQDTVNNNTLVNNSADPNFTIEYIGPGPLGSGGGGGDVPVGGSITNVFDIRWTNVDLMAGTVISPAPCLDVIFAGGLRISKLEQNYNVFIDRGDATTNSQELYSRLQGAGPRIGIETRAYALSCLSLYAKAYSTLLFADRTEQAATVFTDDVGGVTGGLAVYNREEIMPMLELGIGLDVSLFGGRVMVGAGYDFNYLFEAGSTYTEQSTNPRSARHVNLAIDGVNVHMTFLW
jgi:hypothetical protein